MKDVYIFPAVFQKSPEGISIYFPDLPGCLPCADTFENAFKNAREALQLHIFGMEEDGEEIPAPTSPEKIKIVKDEMIALIEVEMSPFREKMKNKSTNKVVKIPVWLDILARKKKINYSGFLQESLKNYLGVA